MELVIAVSIVSLCIGLCFLLLLILQIQRIASLENEVILLKLEAELAEDTVASARTIIKVWIEEAEVLREELNRKKE